MARSSIREELKRRLSDHLALAETHPPDECPLDVRSVATALRISPTTLYKYALNGHVQSVETVLVDMSTKSYKLRPGGREALDDFGNPSAGSPEAPLLWEILKFD